jgi:hypothetical protein
MRIAISLVKTLLIATTLMTILVVTPARANSAPPWETGKSNPADLQFELYTFGVGASLEEWWGHIGLRVADLKLKRDTMYNWGMFAFDENLIKNFIRGKLRFWVEAQPVRPTERLYVHLKRDIRVMTLDLTVAERTRLMQLIAENMRPENVEYDYEYFRNNCSTRIRDLLDETLNGSLGKAMRATPGRMTLRDHVHRTTAKNFLMDLFLSFLLGRGLDAPVTQWEEAFLPDELETALLNFKRTTPNDKGEIGAPAFSKYRIVNKSPVSQVPEQGRQFFPYDILVAGVLSMFFVFPGKHLRTTRRRHRTPLTLLLILYGTVFGFLGTALAYFWAFTYHTYTYWNMNLFVANPITLSLPFLAIWYLKSPDRARRPLVFILAALLAVSILGIAVKAVPSLRQDNWVYFRISIPMILTALLTLWSEQRNRNHYSRGFRTRT